jgi:hypothetical protein
MRTNMTKRKQKKNVPPNPPKKIRPHDDRELTEENLDAVVGGAIGNASPAVRGSFIKSISGGDISADVIDPSKR